MLSFVVLGGDSVSSHNPWGTRNTRKPVFQLSEQTSLPSRQTGLPSRSAGMGFDQIDPHPNPSPSPNKPVGAGASPFCKPKSEVSTKKADDGDGYVLRVDKHVELTKFRRGESELTKIHCQQSQVMKNISNVPNFHGVTNFAKLAELTK
ncbi:hypothetical protein B0H14DRAFT_2563815 [Mycena olivaceomarginata]|nr:hypothetical protein B0H14DRAFT_2563815 [Mycena olivaceomarginata]